MLDYTNLTADQLKVQQDALNSRQEEIDELTVELEDAAAQVKQLEEENKRLRFRCGEQRVGEVPPREEESDESAD